MVRSNVTELRIRTLVLAGLFAVGLLVTTGIPVLAGNSGTSKGSGTWTKTGSMNTARDFHTATLLQSGEVLVAGGIGTSDRLTSAELYDPAHGKWKGTGSMDHARDGHTNHRQHEHLARVSYDDAASQRPGGGCWRFQRFGTHLYRDRKCRTVHALTHWRKDATTTQQPERVRTTGPRFNPLRQDPRVKEVLRRIRLS
jgi:Galactose oxidase, central domain